MRSSGTDPDCTHLVFSPQKSVIILSLLSLKEALKLLLMSCLMHLNIIGITLIIRFKNMHAINRARKERLLLSMLIPLVMSYGAYMIVTYHFMVLEPLTQTHDEVRFKKSQT